MSVDRIKFGSGDELSGFIEAEGSCPGVTKPFKEYPGPLDSYSELTLSFS
jgi:hypothetical protein